MQEVPPENQIIRLNHFVRSGVATTKIRINFVLANGGIGDLVCYLKALKWVEAHWPHVEKVLHTFPFFMETAKHYLDNTWEFKETVGTMVTRIPYGETVLFPDVYGRINLAGTHPLDFGFLWFTNNNTPPDGWDAYPEFNLSKIQNKTGMLPNTYAVMTPGAMVSVRQMPPNTFNEIVNHLLNIDLIPVFIGDSKISGNYGAHFSDKYHYDGLDLRDKTTILEAMKVMSEASVVIGIDNGLLHAAACTDVPVVFGYTVASPKHRAPRRSINVLYNIEPDIACKSCQSNIRYINKDLQGVCMYSDNACLDDLTPEKFINGIEKIRR